MIVLTPYGPGGVSSVGRPKTYFPVSKRGTAQKASPEHNKFDSAVISATAAKNAYQMSVVGRLSQEVRTSTTTGDIQELHRAVAAGEYHPDPMSIARSILFMSEE